MAYEILHSFKRKTGRRKGFFAVKLYMSKAYDKVEWCFLRKVMKAMGFCDEWILIVMKYVVSVSYSTVLNGAKGISFSQQEA